jgi:hypothetical protein
MEIRNNMLTLKDYIDRVLDEENTQGDVGTPKLTKHRMKLTPGQPVVDVEGEVKQEQSQCEKNK